MKNAHAAEQIADNIVALINSRVQSPTKAEIVNIIVLGGSAASMPVPTPTDVRLRELIPVLRAAELEACALDTEVTTETPEFLRACAKRDELCERLHALERETWATPALTWADVQARATVAAFWADAEETGDGSGPIEWLDSEDSYERALAQLLKAVLECGARRLMKTGGAS
jgi:hypothetical protein